MLCLKKLYVILAIVGLIMVGSTLYYESKLLEEPIIIANEVNLDSDTIHLSYITNLIRPSEFQSIEIDGMHYYPENDFFLFYEPQQPTQTKSYVNYTYYSIYSPTISLQMDEKNGHLANATKGTVYFNDGHTEIIDLNVRQYTEFSPLREKWGSSGTEGSASRYEVVEPFTLLELTMEDDRVDLVRFQINNKDVPLPLNKPIQVSEKDTISFATTNGVAYYPGEWFTIELSGIDNQNKTLVIPLIANLSDLPSAEVVDEIVRERRK